MSGLALTRLRARAQEAEAVAIARSLARRYSPHAPTDRQSLFLGLPHQEAFYGGAAGGGKSDALLMAALEHVDTPGYSALLLRRTFQDLSKPGALLDRAREWLAQSGARWNEQRKQWRFPSGAVLAFGYLENEADVYQYQGAEYQFVGFDELTQFTERQYTYLFSRLRRLSGANVPLRMRAASNPGGIGHNWVMERFIPDGWTPDRGSDLQVFEKGSRAFVPARLRDNPHLDQAAYSRSLAELDEVTRAQLEEGDWNVRQRGNIYPAWSDGYSGHHVITWSQFAEVYGSPRIPDHWRGACGQDWGFDPDPCATVWNWTAGENGPLPGAIFCARILTCRNEIPDSVGEKIQLAESERSEAARIEYRVMSHEASSQQATYRTKLGLGFMKCRPDIHGGIAQMQHFLRLRDPDQPHPFKPWLNGRPMYYVIVPDDHLINPRGDEGLALLREEFAVYRYTEQRITEARGAARIVPYDFFNHYMDAQRYVAAGWFPRATPLTEWEATEAMLPETLRMERVAKLPPSEIDFALIKRGYVLGKVKKERDQGRASWSHEVCDPLSDPWRELKKSEIDD